MRGREKISSKRTSMTIDAGNWDMLGIKRVLSSLVGQMVKNLPVSAGDTGLILDPGRFHMLWSN